MELVRGDFYAMSMGNGPVLNLLRCHHDTGTLGAYCHTEEGSSLLVALIARH